MTLFSGAVRDLTLQQMKVSEPHFFHPYPKLHISFSFRGRMIKREGKILKYALVRNHLQILSDPRKSFKEQMQSLCFQKPFKTQVTKRDCSEKI
jgi:hypothetical protein